MSTATAIAYRYGVNGTRPFCASKRRKAQKSSGFRANSTYRHCIKDNVLIDPCCGKTTLCSLIARFWDVKDGEILLGGVNVKDYTCDSLLKNFSIVFQRVYLFEDTIENNILFGKPHATKEEMITAAKKACCHDFISALPDGYQTKIGEGGATLSGGEKQRISIARAILKDAPIVILDEATASVDPENERELQQAISELTKNKTLLMIAHRLNTVRGADQILVLENGQIVQRGKHQELIQQKGLYRRFVEIRGNAIGWKLGGRG